MTLAGPAHSASPDTVVPLRVHASLSTFYVPIEVGGLDTEEYLLDTGAGYMTITQRTLERADAAGEATYMRDLEASLADGSQLRVPVYRLTHITIGNHCHLKNVEAAVLPGASRGLLGLSVLRRASPFTFSVDPPSISLSNCTGPAMTAPGLADATMERGAAR